MADSPIGRVGRALASPVGVALTIPLLVAATGIAILVVGRDAMSTATDEMARRQLAEQAERVQADVAFALDQAGPMLDRLRTLADEARPFDDVGVRLHDMLVGRPGVAYVSLSFADGTFRGAYLNTNRTAEVQESRIVNGRTQVRRFRVDGGTLVPLRDEVTDYDPRKRGFYTLAERTGTRAWTAPYPFFASHETGVSCSEPVYAGAAVRAVLTVDFDVGALSSYVARPTLPGARTMVYTGDGAILAHPAGDRLARPATDRVLRREDVRDPVLDALFALPRPEALRVSPLATAGGEQLAAVAPIGGRRAGVALPLDWYVAASVPSHALLGPTRSLERRSVLVSGGALALAVILAAALAWRLVRMRRQVAASRAEAQAATAVAAELGSYRLVARLGAGGMGEVWRAEHRMLAREAAIKLIRTEALHDAAAVPMIRERFRREAQTLASMRSRHTIDIYDYGVTDAGTFYYVMELLDGLDLESLVVRDGPQPAARVIDILIQACASLAEAHDAGLLHRDIKPPNLYLCRAADEVDIVKLLDFGIVSNLREPEVADKLRLAVDLTVTDSKLTQVGAMLGTPGFMAPEQILGMALDGRADLYALGCVGWWLLAGGEVFTRDPSAAKVLHAHIYDPVPSLCARVPGVPPALDAVLAACLAKDVDARPADARALAQLLRDIPVAREHTWSAADARLWWARHEPAPAPAPVATDEVQMLTVAAPRRRRQA